MHTKNKKFIPIIVILVLVLGYGVYYLFETASQDGNQLFSGTLEADEVHLGVMTGGIVHEVYVKEGDTVKKNQLLASIKTTSGNIRSPIDGVVLLRAIEPDEIIPAGGTILVVGDLREMTLTIYIPEDLYGRVNLGQEYFISVDSFPGRTFSGWVTYISDEAEFTPRNVLTVEGRKNTVYAVRIRIPNPDLALKPGMPADVSINFER
ncbi:MAG: HlyD family secretion protein [Anaerolineaceae bacterium]